MSLTVAIAAVVLLIVLYGAEIASLWRARIMEDKFEPQWIGDITVNKGDMLECTESYGEFTAGYNYIVRVAYGGALVVWNDETKPVLAAGLDPRKFKVVEANVDGTAAKRISDEDM